MVSEKSNSSLKNKEDIKKSLKFKEGDKVMGFHINVSGEILIGGEVEKVIISESIYSKDRYKIKEKTVINDEETVRFDVLKFKQSETFLEVANKLEQRVLELRRMARQVIYSGDSIRD